MARPLSTEARDKMLRSAQTIVRERGLDAFSVEAVASDSGVAKTTIYRHFASADELLLAALAATVREVHDVDTGDLRADLVELMHRYVAMATEPGIRRLFSAVLQRAAGDEDFGRLQQGLVAQRKLPLRRALQRGMAAGAVDATIDIDTAAALVEGPLVARLLHDRTGFRPGEIEQIVDLVLRAVAPPVPGSG